MAARWHRPTVAGELFAVWQSSPLVLSSSPNDLTERDIQAHVGVITSLALSDRWT